MSKKHAPPPSPLVDAALAVERELEELERLVRAATREPLNSDRRIQLTATELGAAAQGQGRLGERLRTLLEALDDARKRMEPLATTLRDRAEELQRRNEALSGLMARLQGLGAEVAALSKQLNDLGPDRLRAGDVLRDSANRISELATAAATLEREATEARFTEAAREGQSLATRLAKLAEVLKGAGGA